MSMVMHTFNYSTYETGKQLSMRSAWSTYWIPGQPLVHSDTLSQIKTWKKKKITGWQNKAESQDSNSVNNSY